MARFSYAPLEQQRKEARHALFQAVASQFIAVMQSAGPTTDSYDVALNLTDWEEEELSSFGVSFRLAVMSDHNDDGVSPEHAIQNVRELFTEKEWGEIPDPPTLNSWGKGANHS